MKISYFDNIYYEHYKGDLYNSAVLLLHGFTGKVTKNEDIAKYLSSNSGHNCFVINYEGLWKSKGDFGFINSITSTLKFFKYLQNSYRKVHLIGHSFGGFVSLNLFTLSSFSIETVTLLCPYLIKLDDSILAQLVEEYVELKNVSDLRKNELIKELHSLEMNWVIPKEHKNKVTIIHGTNDSVIPFEQNKSLAKKLDITFIETDDDHWMENRNRISKLVETIGGMNSSSMIPFLNFNLIREKRKVICGYSDVTSLHLSILQYSKLKTFYGPAIMTWFGEYPDGIKDSIDSFLSAVTKTTLYPRTLKPFDKWSNHKRDWQNGDWKNIPRQWNDNTGWHVLNSGEVESELIIANLNTLTSACGTSYFPNLDQKILLLEDMSAPFSAQERSLRQLQLMGVFDKISGLIFGKPEFPDNEGADFCLDQLIMEIVGKRDYPIVSSFDCSHTVPMHTLQQRTLVKLAAKRDTEVEFTLLESFVE